MIRAVGSLVSSVTPQPRATRPPVQTPPARQPEPEPPRRAPEPRGDREDALPATAIPPVRNAAPSAASQASDAAPRTSSTSSSDDRAERAGERWPNGNTGYGFRHQADPEAPDEDRWPEVAERDEEPTRPFDEVRDDAPTAPAARAPARDRHSYVEDDDMQEVELLLEDARRRAHSAIDDSVRQAQTLLRARKPRERSLGQHLDQRLERLDVSVNNLTSDVRAVQQRLDRIEALLRETLDGRAAPASAAPAIEHRPAEPAELDFPSIASILPPKGSRHRGAPAPRSALPPLRRTLPEAAIEAPNGAVADAEQPAPPEATTAPVEAEERSVDLAVQQAFEAGAEAALETPVEPSAVAPVEPFASVETAEVADEPVEAAPTTEYEPVAEALAELAEAHAEAVAATPIVAPEDLLPAADEIVEHAESLDVIGVDLPPEVTDVARPWSAPGTEDLPAEDVPVAEAPELPALDEPVAEWAPASMLGAPQAPQADAAPPAVVEPEPEAAPEPPRRTSALAEWGRAPVTPEPPAPEPATPEPVTEVDALEEHAAIEETEAPVALEAAPGPEGAFETVAEVETLVETEFVAETTVEVTDTVEPLVPTAAELSTAATEAGPELEPEPATARFEAPPAAPAEPSYKAPAVETVETLIEEPAPLPAVPASAIPPSVMAPERVRFAAEAGSVVLRISPISGFQGLMRVQDALARVSAVREASVEAYSQGEARLRIRLAQETAAGQLATALSERLNQPVRLRQVSSAERTLSVTLG